MYPYFLFFGSFSAAILKKIESIEKTELRPSNTHTVHAKQQNIQLLNITASTSSIQALVMLTLQKQGRAEYTCICASKQANVYF